MNELDHHIRRSLARQASSLREQPDLAALTERIAQHDRRRMRGLSVALAVALLAGPTLGFLAGRAGGQTRPDVVSGSGGERVTVEETPGSLPTVVLRGSDSGAALGAPGTAAQVVESGGASLLGANGPLAKSFVRDVDGTTIRVYRAAIDPRTYAGPPSWEPPAWCFPNGYVQADVSTADAVGIVSGSLYAELPSMSVVGSLGAVGVAEGAPQWVAVAQAPAGAAILRATFPDGQADEMEPIDGVAVLVGPASIEPGDPAEYETTVPLEAFDTDGRSLGTGTARSGASFPTELRDAPESPGPLSRDEQSAECFPPQELPPPGAEQPADPATARAEIERLFGVRFADRSDEERLASIDDPTGMREVYEQMRNGPYAQQVLASGPVFRDLVFLSATRAAVQYETEVPGYPPQAFGQQFGEVVFLDGRWKVTRESVCRDVQLAGVSCPSVR
ncbi:MAG TPA: hypothetical protein VFH30_21005 [Acidimicrobiales bacterium]|nr:hypothetical protein [Acidimicrobiales bacterium]